MRTVIFLFSALVLGASSAHAACAQPVGTFVGAAAGPTIDRKTKATVDQEAASVSVVVNANGGGTIYQVGKSVARGSYSTTRTFVPVSFNVATCSATVKTSLGEEYQLTAAASGTIITLVYNAAGPLVGVYTVRLEKV